MARARRDFRSRRKSRCAANPTSGTSSADNLETDRREAGESELTCGGWRHIDDTTARERPAIGNSHHHRPPFRRLVTRTMVPNGSVRCAAVNALGWLVSPLAVFPPGDGEVSPVPHLGAK